MRNQEGRIELQDKVRQRIYVSDITFLVVRLASYVIFVIFCLRPFFSEVIYLLNGPDNNTVLLDNNTQMLRICPICVIASECIQ